MRGTACKKQQQVRELTSRTLQRPRAARLHRGSTARTAASTSSLTTASALRTEASAPTKTEASAPTKQLDAATVHTQRALPTSEGLMGTNHRTRVNSTAAPSRNSDLHRDVRCPTTRHAGETPHLRQPHAQVRRQRLRDGCKAVCSRVHHAERAYSRSGAVLCSIRASPPFAGLFPRVCYKRSQI